MSSAIQPVVAVVVGRLIFRMGVRPSEPKTADMTGMNLFCFFWDHADIRYMMIKGSLGGETSVLRTFRMSGKELVKERVS
jgi:hypothetical protein